MKSWGCLPFPPAAFFGEQACAVSQKSCSRSGDAGLNQSWWWREGGGPGLAMGMREEGSLGRWGCHPDAQEPWSAPADMGCEQELQN